MLYVMIPPIWLKESDAAAKARQLDCSFEEALAYNEAGYNLYYYPNYPSTISGDFVKAGEVDTFEWVFLDMDLKDKVYGSKDEFLALLDKCPLPPTKIVVSGNGVHAYWRVSDLDPMSFLRLSKRLSRLYNTDPAVCQLKQLMRVAPSMNTKDSNEYKLCEEISNTGVVYTCEQVSSFLPPLGPSDAALLQQHYDKAHNLGPEVKIDDKLPLKFAKLMKASREVQEIWKCESGDRSSSDFRLGHILFAEGFTKEEAISVLVNCQKALSRGPSHRYNYAQNITDKIWTFENTPEGGETATPLSSSVRDILRKGISVKGDKLPCWEVYDGTFNGFRTSQILGLIGGSGSGKTTLALNYFYWFTKLNPQYIHLFVSLEQPEQEIADRWCKITQGNDSLHDKVHVLSNYNADGSYRNLSLSEIEDYVIELEARESCKVGCIVIDHIGVLKKISKEGETQGLIDICHAMKAFAKRTNTFLVMQSQTSREKAGIGDLELDKDAAYGTSMFEWYCDYVVTTWQPLKRVYDIAPHMTCSAFKYCKIRHKNVLKDHTREDVVHALMFDPNTELLREMSQKDEVAYNHFSSMATTIRNKDRKREPTKLTTINWVGKESNAKNKSN